MGTRKNEQEILRKALNTFERTTDLIVKVYHEIEPEGPDAVIGITLNDMEWHFAVEIKNTLTPAMIGTVVQQIKRNLEKGLIVTKYITPQIADTLKEMDVPFIDTAGNAYINKPPLFVFIKGNMPIEMIPEKTPTRAFRPTGLQVIFTLLCNPKLEDGTFREIARVANVALGTVGWVMQDLKQMGYLIDMGKRGRRLIKKEKLLARWVTTYPEQLRPKKIVGRYEAKDHDFWKYEDLPHDKAYWGGEVAAAKLNRYLKPEIVTIYTVEQADLNNWFIKNRIKKDPEGKIEILQTFWDAEQKTPYQNLVHPILIYADLQATGDPRNIETAEMIYDQELTQLIRED